MTPPVCRNACPKAHLIGSFHRRPREQDTSVLPGPGVDRLSEFSRFVLPPQRLQRLCKGAIPTRIDDLRPHTSDHVQRGPKQATSTANPANPHKNSRPPIFGGETRSLPAFRLKKARWQTISGGLPPFKALWLEASWQRLQIRRGGS